MKEKESKLWDGRPESEYLKQISKIDITHEDQSFAICAHPKLPIYVTGNTKGLVCVWQFNQHSNRCLNFWQLEPEMNIKDAQPKKSTVKKIEFTPYGDKFVSLNLEGTVFLHSFELYNDRSALYTLRGYKASDFGIMDNEGTVIAVLSH